MIFVLVCICALHRRIQTHRDARGIDLYPNLNFMSDSNDYSLVSTCQSLQRSRPVIPLCELNVCFSNEYSLVTGSTNIEDSFRLLVVWVRIFWAHHVNTKGLLICRIGAGIVQYPPTTCRLRYSSCQYKSFRL